VVEVASWSQAYPSTGTTSTGDHDSVRVTSGMGGTESGHLGSPHCEMSVRIRGLRPEAACCGKPSLRFKIHIPLPSYK